MTTTGPAERLPTSQAAAEGDAMKAAVPLLAEFLDDAATRAADRIDPAGGHVAVTLNIDHVPLTVGASSRLALETDLLQYAIGAGPCLHALRSGQGMYVPDLGRDSRWGDYGPRAAALGAACCVSAPVLVAGEPLAVVKAYAAVVDGFTDQQCDLVADSATEIAGGIGLARRLAAQASELDDRSDAMDTRRMIDLAIGILMERNQASAGASFDLVRRYSQHFNLKLVDAAAQIVAAVTGDLDPHAPFARRRSS